MRWSAKRTEAVVAWLPAFGVLVLSFAELDPTPLQEMGYSQHLLPSRAVLGTVIIVVTAVTLRLIHRWRWPFFALAPLGWLTYALFPAAIVASYQAARTFSRRALTQFLIISLIIVWIPISVGIVRRDDTGAGNLLLDGFQYSVLLIGLPVAFGFWNRSRWRLSQAQQEAREEKARVLERARIARELHDIVAHRVSLMVLHAGALEIAAKDDRTRQTAELLRHTGREALNELRQVLELLRGPGSVTEPQPTLADIGRLVERTRAAGVPVTLSLEGAENPLPATVERTAYRIVQESLTNVVKHAGFPQTTVLLRHMTDGLEVRVDNGTPTSHADRLPRGAGLGLIGLRERVELMDGTFEAGPAGDGYAVRVFLPVTGGVEDDPGPDR